jgi:hypothetical protein
MSEPQYFSDVTQVADEELTALSEEVERLADEWVQRIRWVPCGPMGHYEMEGQMGEAHYVGARVARWAL